jgi:hypothetical protein
MWKRLIRKNKVEIRNNDFSDLDLDEIEIIDSILPYTMTSKERLVSMIRAIKYLEKYNISGDFLECGVWKGGSVMAMILSLKSLGSERRKIWLCDTFQGMTEPVDEDSKFDGTLAKSLLDSDKDKKSNVWAVSSLDEVKTNIQTIDYPSNKISYVIGPVEETLPNIEVGNIALLRLDTDWYESTKIELELLFPKVVKGGVLIIDDYGHWKGCKKAVDEYFEKLEYPVLLNRIDYTGRIFIKYW